ncbi:hypothetical protein ATK78_3941 [Pedobacter metabolipauper]|uniref:Uncharacterized protein n=1 Tax=Pedobacter metabolipauper TaxID=425513 RepID=A0A4V3D0Q5_9SPHI|nr:hypothetical protein ATK78_3941 [Pedobacter metabolipauper]
MKKGVQNGRPISNNTKHMLLDFWLEKFVIKARKIL